MKILIAYATRYGTTEKCVKMLSEILRKKNFEVELVDLKRTRTVKPENFDMAVVGGSFLIFKMNAYVVKFVRKHLSALLTKKTGIFMCGGEEDWEKEIIKGFPEELLDKAEVKGYFGYEMLWDKMNPIMRSMGQKASQTTEPISKINAENIKKFAEEIEKALS